MAKQASTRPAATLPGTIARLASHPTGTVTDGATGKPTASVTVLGTTGTPVTGGVSGGGGTFALPFVNL